MGLIWALILVTAAAVAFPKTAKRVRDKAAEALGVDIGGAMEVFNREVKAKNVFFATKEAFKYAFDPSGGGDLEVLADGADGRQKTDETTPKGTDEGDEGGTAKPPEETAAGSFDDLPLPENVDAGKPRESLVLAGPLAGEVVRGFGYAPNEDGDPVFHYGIDVRGEDGASVRCVADGTVTAVGDSAVFGTYLIVDHGDGIESVYAMLGETPLTEGTAVEAGAPVGTLSGNTLHMELLADGSYVNPQYYVYRNEKTES